MYHNNHQKLLDQLTIKRGNLLEIRPTQVMAGSAIQCINPGTSESPIILNNKHIVYQPSALKLLG